MAKQKFYVVWHGRVPGVYKSWEECLRQVDKFENAKYKAFDTETTAWRAFAEGAERHIVAQKKEQPEQKIIFDEKPILDSVSVDAAWNHISKVMEYRGVETKTGKELFRKGPFADATNNIGEFLAVVHALALLKKENKNIPVYSDSNTAIKWVKDKKVKTTLEPTENNTIIFELIERAEKWLQENKYDNPVLKWHTEIWGEIPADFGRK